MITSLPRIDEILKRVRIEVRFLSTKKMVKRGFEYKLGFFLKDLVKKKKSNDWNAPCLIKFFVKNLLKSDENK